MNSKSEFTDMTTEQGRDYGFARVRDIAFDAVRALWRRRQAEGMQQKELVKILGRDPSRVSKNLRGPGNWTLRTFGEFVWALRGQVEILIQAEEDPPRDKSNYHAYDPFDESKTNKKSETSGGAIDFDDLVKKKSEPALA